MGKFTFDQGSRKRFLQVLTVFCVTFGICGLYAHFLVFNYTRSLSPGFYLKVRGEAFERGKIVIFCPDPLPNILEGQKKGYFGKGSCSCGGLPLIKVIEGVPGDHVSVTEEGVAINGRRLSGSRRAVSMETAYALPHEEILGAHEYFVMTPHPNSFDSRYFGKVSDRLFQSTLQPIFVWE